ncbi:MAG: hypothetical protein FWD48_03975 [Oscillospiraceae bacterium]|nr:hypothetical protein [Oscillospiraceae bacterium]
MNNNREKLLRHSSNAKRLSAEGLGLISLDGKMAKSKFERAIYELDSMREKLKQYISDFEETQVNNELADMLKKDSDCNTSASGSVEIIGESWLHLRIEMLLPSDKNHVEIRRLSNTVTKLLDLQSEYAGYLPQYEQALLVIIEHTSPEKAQSYDHDNKGYRAIPNALKGRIFDDDNQFTMSLGLFSVHEENDPHCDIYVIPVEDIADFAAHYLNFNNL